MASYPRSIPTWWKGIKMRSKLEASWARWLDGHGIAWTYEPEAWCLEHGIAYLPDFWLPQMKTVLEVKGILDRVSEAKLIALAKAAAAAGVLVLLAGAPGQDWRPVAPTPLDWQQGLTTGSIAEPAGAELLRCQGCGRWVFTEVVVRDWTCRICGIRHGSADGMAHPHLGGRFQAMTCQECLHLPPLREES